MKKVNLYYLHKMANNFIYTQKINVYYLLFPLLIFTISPN